MKNTLIIGDTHLPFEHPDYLGFCCRIRDKFKCEKVFHVGDLCDNHAISYHEHDCNGLSSAEEVELTRTKLKEWFKHFPKVDLCIGNHDELAHRKALTHGLADFYIKSYRDVWNLPKRWNIEHFYQYNGIKIFHGTGFSGLYPHVNAVKANRQSCIIGHCHAVAGVHWTASEHDVCFGLSVGCGIDRNTYAFQYGRHFKYKPILGCGVIKDGGEQALFVPMKMD